MGDNPQVLGAMERAKAMHRRAQVAEGALQRARFWVECIVEHTIEEQNAARNGMWYIRSLSFEAIKEMDKIKSKERHADALPEKSDETLLRNGG